MHNTLRASHLRSSLPHSWCSPALHHTHTTTTDPTNAVLHFLFSYATLCCTDGIMNQSHMHCIAYTHPKHTPLYLDWCLRMCGCVCVSVCGSFSVLLHMQISKWVLLYVQHNSEYYIGHFLTHHVVALNENRSPSCDADTHFRCSSHDASRAVDIWDDMRWHDSQDQRIPRAMHKHVYCSFYAPPTKRTSIECIFDNRESE